MSAWLSLFAAAWLSWSSVEEEIEAVDFDRLINVEYEEGRPLPDDIQALDGKKVKVQGFMDNYTPEGTSKFMLVTDACGCDGQPKVHHFIDVDIGDRTTGYTPALLTLTGTLSVGEERDEDGYVVSVWRLQADTME